MSGCQPILSGHTDLQAVNSSACRARFPQQGCCPWAGPGVGVSRGDDTVASTSRHRRSVVDRSSGGRSTEGKGSRRASGEWGGEPRAPASWGVGQPGHGPVSRAQPRFVGRADEVTADTHPATVAIISAARPALTCSYQAPRLFAPVHSAQLPDEPVSRRTRAVKPRGDLQLSLLDAGWRASALDTSAPGSRR
jgi:hypothetical protein